MARFALFMLVLLCAFGSGISFFTSFLNMKAALEGARIPHAAYAVGRAGFAIMLLVLAELLLVRGTVTVSAELWIFMVGLTMAVAGQLWSLFYTIRGVAEFETSGNDKPPPPPSFHPTREDAFRREYRQDEEGDTFSREYRVKEEELAEPTEEDPQ